MYTLNKNYSGNGVALKAGKYTKEQLIELYGSEKKLNFCLKCTSLKTVVKIDEPIANNRVDKREIYNKADLDGCATKDEGLLAPPIAIDTKKELEVKGKLDNNYLISEPIMNEEIKEEKSELTLEDYQKIAKEKELKHSHRMGIVKLKKLIEDNE
tara:strand:- start:53 stop:517 length:465 start_codon:yes stop_codon:yes gene_type:complete